MKQPNERPIRVLYVDDSRFDRELVREALRTSEWRFELVEAASQSMFEDFLQRQEYDVVLSDFNIMGFEGLQVIDAVESHGLDIPVIIVTGTGSEEVAVAAMKRGAADYVIKTTSHVQKLPHTIVASLRKKQLERERRQALEQLQHNEEHYRSLIENARDLITVCDAEGNIRYQSASVARVLGYNAQELQGANLLSMAHPEDRKHLGRRFSECLRQKSRRSNPSGWLEFRLRHKKGSWRVLEASLSNLLSHPAVRGLVINASDVTQRRILEREILQVSSREQRRIGQDLHDDLGQLLTAVGLRLAGLRQDLERADRPQAEDAAQIGQLVEQAIERTRALAHGLNPVADSGYGLAEALQRLAEFSRRNLGVSCRVSCPAQFRMCDPEAAAHIYRIVQEAVSNAVRHGQARNITIEVASDNGAAPGRSKRGILRICDDGTGIGSGSSSSDQGMGLRIMEHRARLIGGSCSVSARPEGSGTLVQCWFKL